MYFTIANSAEVQDMRLSLTPTVPPRLSTLPQKFASEDTYTLSPQM